MATGDFYKRNTSTGHEFEVVLRPHGQNPELCKKELRDLGVTVLDGAAIGDFTIHLDSPMDWARVGGVVIGEIFGEEEQPREAG